MKTACYKEYKDVIYQKTAREEWLRVVHQFEINDKMPNFIMSLLRYNIVGHILKLNSNRFPLIQDMLCFTNMA